ncbi:MAG: hypothetical protein HY796_13365 [Elusimicrobia bacterium]|nr:hypothetical protein [Elusimicrobiota bacterium]
MFSAVLALSAACSASRPDIIQVGPWFESRPPDEVALFFSREETAKPWGAIAIIHSSRFPPNDKSAIANSKKQARIMAAEIGADGLILTEETVKGDPQIGVYQEPEVYISALAFKYAADISTAPQK